jgi:hypothetical protein
MKHVEMTKIERIATKTVCFLITFTLTIPFYLCILYYCRPPIPVASCLLVIFLFWFMLIYFLTLALHLESLKTEELEKKQNAN